ncbi:MAG: YraN family protein [Gammaproteobacteria bacterium]
MAAERGADFEALAEAWLNARGLHTVARNYRCRAGEIDLVMQQGATLVFVEVRYRRSSRFGGAAASVDGRKRERIVRAARHYLARHPALGDRPCRFDVMALEGDGDAPEVDWIEGAFSA